MNDIVVGFRRLGRSQKGYKESTTGEGSPLLLLRLLRGEVPENLRYAGGFLCHSKLSVNRSLRPGAICPEKLRIDLLRL
jgi:hypothetical protein